jgi:hypothetical protein
VLPAINGPVLALALAVAGAQAPQHFPPGLQGSRILDGTARLVLPGGEPDAALTLLPPGVFFTDVGYAALSDATTRLQEDVQALRTRADDCARPALLHPPAPVIVQQGWSGKTLVVVSVASAVVGLLVSALVLR